MESEVCTCSECGIEYRVPGNWYRSRRDDHASFWCPNGHEQHFSGKSDKEKLSSRLDAERRRIGLLSDQLNTCSLSRRALKGQVTKLRNKLDPD